MASNQATCVLYVISPAGIRDDWPWLMKANNNSEGCVITFKRCDLNLIL